MRRLTSPVFIGRVAELADLRDAYERAAQGRPATVLVGGEAGVGKSRLLSEFASAAAEAGARVLHGACVAMGEGVLPYAAVVEALRPLARERDRATLAGVLGPARASLERLLPELGTEGDGFARDVLDPDQGRLFELLLGVFERVAAERATVVILEDLHWADGSTRDLFTFLAHNLHRQRLLLIGSYRSDELHRRHPLRPFLAELERRGEVEQMQVARFSSEEVRAQLEAIMGAEPEHDLSARILARSGGNPFFVEELVAAEATASGDSLPVTLREILATRLETVSDETQALLRVVAVAGRSVDEQFLLAVTGLRQDELDRALHEAIEHHVLIPTSVPSSDRYAFRHALLEEAVYSDLLAGERKRLHAAVAEALTADVSLAATKGAGAIAERAYHWYRARRLREALVSSIEAGVASERGYAYAEALSHFERALDVWGEVADATSVAPLDRIELNRRAAEAAARSRDAHRAVALTRVALAEVDEQRDPLRAGQLQAELSIRLARTGDDEGFATALADGFRLLPVEPPTRARALLLRNSACHLFIQTRYREAHAVAEEALGIARQLGAASEQGEALEMLVIIDTWAGDVEAGIGHAAERRRIAEEAGDVPGIASAYLRLGIVLQAALRFDEAVSAFLRGAEVARPHGMDRSLASECETEAAEALRRAGRWREADILSADLPERAGRDVAAVAHAMRALLLAGMGRADEAERHADAARTAVDGNLGAIEGLYFTARVDVALLRGRLEEARAAAAALDTLRRSEDVRWVGEIAVRGLRIEADLAERARARRLAEALEEARRRGARVLERMESVANRARERQTIFAAESDAPVLLGRAEWTRLEARSDPRAWSRASRAWLDIGQPHQSAYAQYRQAEAMLAARGQRHAAEAVLREALRIAVEIGAEPLASDIRSLGRRARLTLEVAADHATGETEGHNPLLGYGLTHREREVLSMLAEGRTDRQIAETLFISDKTASVHVSNIKGKLGVETRLQAATLAMRLTQPDQPAATQAAEARVLAAPR